MKQYYRVTFKPSGGTRKQTVWAEYLRKVDLPTGTGYVFKKLNKHGEEPKADTVELILVGPEDKMLPAKMNMHYAQLEVC